MNEANHGSLPACQRLDAAGIVLETEYWWNPIDIIEGDHTVISGYELKDYKILGSIPAPSMAEAWRRLPAMSVIGKDYGEVTYVAFKKDYKISNANPTDALIDLLIWVEQRKEEGR